MAATFAFAGDTFVGETISAKLQDAGYVLAAGLASADYIFTYCLAQSQLEDVYLGTGGAVEQAKEGCCLVDLSPSTTTLAKEIYAVARVNELQSVDAPLVLLDPCAHDAFGDPENIMVFAGGEDDAVDDVLPLLQVISNDVRPTGLPGSGQFAKAICTAQQASALVSLVEAHAIARAQGESAAPAIAAAVEAGLLSYAMAQKGRRFRGGDGIVTRGVEGTIRNIGILAREGMRETDKVILQIMLNCEDE